MQPPTSPSGSNPGVTTLGTVTAAAQARADMVNSSFLSASEWTANINASYQELYGLLTEKYGSNYYFQTPFSITTDGTNYLYALPSDFFKLFGADLFVGGQWTTLKPFMFAERNRFTFSNGIPTASQLVRLWYAPRLTILVNGADTARRHQRLRGVRNHRRGDQVRFKRGESDVSVLMAQKQAITTRIESEADNRRMPGCPRGLRTLSAQRERALGLALLRSDWASLLHRGFKYLARANG